MNADIISPFYFPIASDEIPIGRKLQHQQKQKQTEMAHKRGKSQPTMPSIGKAADSNAATATTSLQTPVIISEEMHREPAAMYRNASPLDALLPHTQLPPGAGAAAG